jgi:lysophospholipase L1-like esterase
MCLQQHARLTFMAVFCLCLLLAPLPAAARTNTNYWDNLDSSWQSNSNGGVGYTLNEDLPPRFLASAIGDSLTDSGVLHGILYDRANDPGFAFRSIPGGTQFNWHGMPGGTTGSILAAVQDQNLGAGEGANFVIIMAGTNDIDYNRHDDIKELAPSMVSNVQAMVDSVLGGQTDPNSRPAVIVMGIPSYLDPDWTARAKTYNDLLRNSLKHVDIFSDANWYSLYDPNSQAAAGNLMEDVKHPNDDGFYRIAENDFAAMDALYNPTRISQNSHIYKGDSYFQRH